MEKPEAVERHDTNDEPTKTLDDLKKSITVDTVHNDEALKVLATYAGSETWEPSEEKKLVRKIDRRLVSILCVTYGLQYYDKAMLSQAVRTLQRLRQLVLTLSSIGHLWTTNRSRT